MSIFNKIVDVQKLDMAWQKVYRNKPASGVDGVTFEDFEQNKKAYLKQLNIELKEHTYQSLPVKLVTIYKGEKAREVALYSMRDKVVQQAIATELTKLYEDGFPKSTCAYRSGRSALHVLQNVENYLTVNKDSFYLKMDITQYFDHIDQEILVQILRRRIQEEDVLELMRETWQAPSLSQDGTLAAKEVGIYQGSGMAPVLSNVYLQEFDEEMEKRCKFYVRYSDDMLAIGHDKKELDEILAFTTTFMEGRGLSLKEQKTILDKVGNGFEFLGHRFDDKGKSIPAKAEEQLKERLESMWLAQMQSAIEEKLKKGAEILGGWEQYYREERKIGSMIEYAVAIYMTKNRSEECFQKLRLDRSKFQNSFLDIHRYLSEIWREHKDWKLELLEYEQLYQVEELDRDVAIPDSSPYLEQLLECFREMGVLEKEEHFTSLIQTYTDLGCYNKASAFMEEYQRFQSKYESKIPSVISFSQAEQDEVTLNGDQLMDYMQLFVGREDLYAEEVLKNGGRWSNETIPEPLTEKIVRKHLRGETTVNTYIQRTNNTSKYLIVDIDISKNVLLQWGNDSAEFTIYLERAGKYAAYVQSELRKLGVTGYIQESGYRGFHVWIFFSEWIPTRYVNMLSDAVEERIKNYEKGEELTIEFFPNKSRVRPGKLGQTIRLPLGIHRKTGKRSRFLEEDFKPVNDYGIFLGSVAKASCTTVKRILGTCLNHTSVIHEVRPVDEDLSEFGNIQEEIQVVLKKCTLMRYLCQKSRKTGYLSHFERLTILYVFGHMGNGGKEFVHTVMKFTLNYQYHVTDRFIQKIPEKPISCLKLREQYKQVTAEHGCSCSFQRTRNCYPSPVLHAIRSAEVSEESDITMPTSRTLTKEKEKTVYEEINVHKKAQELAERILDMKRQKRKLDKSIQNIERELEKVFDSAQVQCMEIEIGLLVRRKLEGGGYEWLIEI